MAEEHNPQAASQNQEVAVQFQIQRIYLKDFSFEAPQGAAAFKKQWQPKINQDLNTSANKLDDDVYEVVLKITIEAKLEDKTAFLVEVQQAGIFLIKGVEGTQLAQIINTLCPQTLFPYAREAIDNAALKGSFPALSLPPINFDVLFQQAIAKAQAEREASGAEVN